MNINSFKRKRKKEVENSNYRDSFHITIINKLRDFLNYYGIKYKEITINRKVEEYDYGYYSVCHPDYMYILQIKEMDFISYSVLKDLEENLIKYVFNDDSFNVLGNFIIYNDDEEDDDYYYGWNNYYNPSITFKIK